MDIGILLFLLLLGLIAGKINETRHFRSIKKREKIFKDMPLTDLKSFPFINAPEKNGCLVTGEAVIATDFMKSFLAGLRKLLGGELKSYNSLLERARREAVLRMMAQVSEKGHNAVCNVRIETSAIGGMAKKGSVMVAIFAFGTAYTAETK